MQGTEPGSAHRQMGHIARGGAIGLVGAAVSAVSSFVLIVVVTRVCSPHVAGSFFTVTSVFLLLTPLASLGTETGLARFMLRYETHGRAGDISLALRAAFRPVLVVSTLATVAVLVAAEPLAELIGIGEQQAPVLRCLAVVLPAAVLAETSLAGTRAFGRMRTTVFVDKMVRSMAQPTLVLLSSLVGVSLLPVTIAWSVPYLVSAVLGAVLFRRFLFARRRRYEVAGPVSDYGSVRREFWTFTWPRGITRLAQMGIQRADIILIAALRSPAEAAVYTAATRFVVLGQLANQAIQQALQPRVTALLAAGDRPTLREVYRISTAWSMALSWPVYLVVGSAPAIYLSLFGSGYRGSGETVVVVMMFAMLLSVACGPADTLLLMSGRSLASLGIWLLSLTVDIVLCLVLVPSVGILGAALAWALAVAARCFLALALLHRFVGVTGWSGIATYVAAASLVCFLAPLVAIHLSVGMSLPILAMAVPLCGLGYAGALWLGRKELLLGALGSLFVRRGT